MEPTTIDRRQFVVAAVGTIAGCSSRTGGPEPRQRPEPSEVEMTARSRPKSLPRSLARVTGVEPMQGSGILRPFPSESLRHLDPFVFLDTGTPKQLGRRDIYVGPHPHRGVQPVSLLFRGRIEHRDSLGNQSTVESGGMQWLMSGRGALHEEVLCGDDDGVFHMAQLWINLPATRKMDAPAHHALPAERIPVIDTLGPRSRVRLYAGKLGPSQGPAPLLTPVLVAHCTLGPGGAAEIPVPRGWTTAFTVVAGTIRSAGQSLGPGDTPVFADDGDHIAVESPAGGQLLVMAGEPIGEPIATGGGFVMNTPDEIRQAFADYRGGRMGMLTASRG